MFEIYFDEYNVSEQKLKEKIHYSLDWLNKWKPDEWSADLIEYANPSKSSLEILSELTNIPQLSHLKPTFAQMETDEILRLVAISLGTALDRVNLDFYLFKHMYMLSANYILLVRYGIATEILTEKLGMELNSNTNAVQDYLSKGMFSNDADEIAISFMAAKKAREEIDRLYSEESAKQYVEYIEDFELAIYNYTKQHYFNACGGSFLMLIYEAIIKHSNLIDDQIQLGNPITTDDRNEGINKFMAVIRRSVNARLEKKHGGNRKGEGSFWTVERKVEFYKMVESIPKINRKKDGSREDIYIWEYIYERFDSRGFEAKESLKSEQSYKSIPSDLFNEAFGKWQKYEENYSKINSEDSPKMFLFRHTLKLLNFQSEYFCKRENRYIPYKKINIAEIL